MIVEIRTGLADLARSSTVRLVSAIAGVFLLAFVGVGVAVHSTVSTYVERRILDTLETDAAGLEALWHEGGTAALARAVERRRGETGAGGFARVRLVIGPDGEKLAGDFAAWPNDLAVTDDRVRFHTAEGAAYAGVVRRIEGGPDLLVAHAVAEHDAVMRALARDLLMPMVAALLAALAVTALVGRRLLARVERVNLVARRVEAGDLAARVGASGPDEFGRLAAHVDAMLERIATLMRGVHHLSDHIAHEMRTPLARLRARLDFARRLAETTPAAAPLVPPLDEAVAESTDLIAVFAALLDIARTEAASGDARGLAVVDLAEIAALVVDLYEATAEDRGIRLELATASAPVLGERMLLLRMAANLVDNAVKFSPDGAVVDLVVEATATQCRLVVRDRGPGVPEGFETRAFERFTRADTVGTVPGHGLGLALVGAIALRHGMKIALERADPGLRVVVTGARAAD